MARGVGGHSPANIMKHLKGIEFPARKKNVIEHAMKTQGPETEDVMEILQDLPEKTYHSPAEVMKEVGQIE